jgi:hypothetical protein
MGGLNALFASSSEEPFNSGVAEAPDHVLSVALHARNVNVDLI